MVDKVGEEDSTPAVWLMIGIALVIFTFLFLFTSIWALCDCIENIMNIWTFLTLIVFSFIAFLIYLSYKLEDRVPKKEKRVFKWHKAYRLIGGSLTIIASIPSIIVSGSIIFFSHIPGCIVAQAIYVLMFIVPILGMVGGILSIMRRHYRFAVIGALFGVLGSLLTVYVILGFGVMAALIGLFLIAFSKRQFVEKGVVES